jgi:hypothetical protein
MSNRPPATYIERYVDTTGVTSNGSSAWPQSNSAPTTLTNIATRGTLHLQGILFEAGGTFVATPSAWPIEGTAVPIAQAVVASGFYEQVPTSIDPSTTAFPLVLYYGPLGLGAR